MLEKETTTKKKKLNLAKLYWYGVLIYMTGFLSFVTYNFGDYVLINTQAKIKELTDEDIPDYNKIGEYKYLTQVLLERLPSNVLNTFISDDCCIEGLEYLGNNLEQFSGITLEDVIYIHNDSISISNALIHEFGHYVDIKLNRKSNTEEWHEIYLEEKDKFVERQVNPLADLDQVKDYVISDEDEFFAEVFSESVLFPLTSKLTTPKAYQYVKKCVEEIK